MKKTKKQKKKMELIPFKAAIKQICPNIIDGQEFSFECPVMCFRKESNGLKKLYAVALMIGGNSGIYDIMVTLIDEDQNYHIELGSDNLYFIKDMGKLGKVLYE